MTLHVLSIMSFTLARGLVFGANYRMLKVVIEAGEVVTAYRVSRMKQGETVLWRA